jgi:hypothetical protein
MKKAFPFHPFTDSLFGECLLKAWESQGNSGLELSKLIHQTFLNKPAESEDGGFVFTTNIKKEMILSELPIRIRGWIQEDNLEAVAVTLRDLAKGKYENQETPGLDLAFELLEWLVTGFELDSNIYQIILGFFGSDQRISESLLREVQKNYRLALENPGA